MGCGSSKSSRYVMEVLPEPTSRPLESLMNDRDAAAMAGHQAGIRAVQGKYFFGGSSGDYVRLAYEDFAHDRGVEIGSGGFGVVKATLHIPTGAIVAVKHVKRGRDAHYSSDLAMETTALARLQGMPFVVKFYGRADGPSHDCFVEQLLQGGELYSHLKRTPGKRFAEPIARFYAAELVACLEGIHSQGMAYRDLKPENLCLDSDGHLILVDFGFCCPVNEKGLAFGHVGTPYFMSPEILDPKSKDLGYPAQAVDWWAFGCALWEMLGGAHPFGDPTQTKHEVFIKITHSTARPPLFLSGDARSLLTALLSLDFRGRIKSASEVKRHPWFAGVDWDAVAERRVRPPWKPTLSSAADCRYFPRSKGRAPPLEAPDAMVPTASAVEGSSHADETSEQSRAQAAAARRRQRTNTEDVVAPASGAKSRRALATGSKRNVRPIDTEMVNARERRGSLNGAKKSARGSITGAGIAKSRRQIHAAASRKGVLGTPSGGRLVTPHGNLDLVDGAGAQGVRARSKPW
jgi:serine/threonine protein kinase